MSSFRVNLQNLNDFTLPVFWLYICLYFCHRYMNFWGDKLTVNTEGAVIFTTMRNEKHDEILLLSRHQSSHEEVYEEPEAIGILSKARTSLNINSWHRIYIVATSHEYYGVSYTRNSTVSPTACSCWQHGSNAESVSMLWCLHSLPIP